MKNFISLFCLLLLYVVKAQGQIEFVKQYSTDKNLSAFCHVIDGDGNTYILSGVSLFHDDSWQIFDGDPYYYYPLYKVDASGSIVWEKDIRDKVAQVKQMFIKDNLIFIPFSVEGSCATKQHEHVVRRPAGLFCGIFVNNVTGEIIKNVTFNYKGDVLKNRSYDDDSASSYFLLCAAMHKDNSISYLLATATNETKNYKLLLIEMNDTLGYVKKDFCGVIKSVRNAFYDPYADQYIISADSDIEVHNRDWSIVHKISLLPVKGIKYPPVYAFACNEKYYIINYGSERYTDDYRNLTAVFTKDGNQISIKESPHYEVLQINKDNIISSIPQNWHVSMFDRVIAPVAITCMNIHQDIVNEIKIGRPYVIANSISFTNDNHMVVTGTSATTSSRKLPKAPDGIYFYKEQLSK